MSRLLAIETSSEACSVALSTDGETSIRAYHEPRRHAELLLPAVRELLAEAGTGLESIDAIAFGRGPGSFTSLRIGIGAVQGLAWGAELGVVPISSLAALAQRAAVHHRAEVGTRILTAMDARMGEVFHALYSVGDNGIVELLGEEQVSAPASITVGADARIMAAGNGFERYPELTAGAGPYTSVDADLWPSAAEVIILAEHWLQANQPLPAHRAQPVYVRDEVAEKPGAP